ncbi:hypothetical protein P7H22_20620 [Paenibacillus larvae]|nr:hypothetical protein [Paenibacillus larvae]MDT2242271.1 hypothetical protein [Paenibacillus larvae]
MEIVQQPFPEIIDSQNAFIPIRRMMDWIQNYVTLTYWQHLDDPSDKRLIETVTDSLNIWFNGLQASGLLFWADELNSTRGQSRL